MQIYGIYALPAPCVEQSRAKKRTFNARFAKCSYLCINTKQNGKMTEHFQTGNRLSEDSNGEAVRGEGDRRPAVKRPRTHTAKPNAAPAGAEPEVVFDDDEVSYVPRTTNATETDDEQDEHFFDETSGIRIYEHHRLRVDPGQEPIRVDLFLTFRIKHLTRSRVKNACLAGFIRINNQVIDKTGVKIKPFDEVSITLPFPPSPELAPEDIPLDIVYEDDHLIVINKQAGLVCHPGCGNFRGTLINALLHHFNQGGVRVSPFGDPIRPGLAHRIDKDTSGLLVVAKNEPSYNSLARQFYERTTDRIYYALAWGNIRRDEGTIVGNIGRSPLDRKHFIVHEDGAMGKHAVTHYQVVARFGVCTLVRCKLETGRTHQIRVHMKYMGHTLFGDRFYGGHRILRGKPSKAYQRFMEECLALMPRQALHARTLAFNHPVTGERMNFSCPIPDDFKALVSKLTTFMNIESPPHLADDYVDQPFFP
jgi:23S rRNA pseudouridine1911/1915/1917 synthase